MDTKSLLASLRGLTVYRDLLSEPVMECALRLVQSVADKKHDEGLAAYGELFYQLARSGHDGLGSWLAETLRRSESPYPLLAERSLHDDALEQAARWDIDLLQQLAEISCEHWLAELGNTSSLPRWKSGAPFSFHSQSHLPAVSQVPPSIFHTFPILLSFLFSLHNWRNNL